MIRAPLSKILPSFVPVLLERGVPGYATEETSQGEARLSETNVRSLLAASAYLGALDYAGQHLDSKRVESALTQSLEQLQELAPEERAFALKLIKTFFGYRIIRENHAFDDWLCEAWWSTFQPGPYKYPSAMSGAVFFGLSIRDSLRKCALEY